MGPSVKSVQLQKKKNCKFSAKLYYTSFWDKFGMNINYFGMHPKT